MTVGLALERPIKPYPGLRPFEAHEWSIFFGRERMIDDVIERLAGNGLVLIHGASGSGKSSLVRAGIMPKLARQHRRHGQPWLTCAMRPSGGPLWNLATEFARLEGRGEDNARIGAIIGLLTRRDATLAQVTGAIAALVGKSLFILIDQFEEIFRFEKETSREEAELFVDLVARATATGDVHVVVTMRSEFLGECARFAGFAEIINRTQYLVPRLDDEALLRAVRRPAQLFNGSVDEALADRLIAQVRGREDELPLLQHGLMLMWDEAVREAGDGGRVVLDGTMVAEAGGLAELLSAHADRVMASVAPDAVRETMVETLFRELTDVNAEGSAIRRPRTFAALAAVVGAPPDDLRPILDAFRAAGASFLTPYAPVQILDSTVIDISHEALIRCWRRIASGQNSWLKREFDDGLAWRSLLAEAEAYERDRKRVLSAAATKERGGLFAARNEPWSRRYGGGWQRVRDLLDSSHKSASRTRRVTWTVMASLVCLSIGASILAYVGFFEWKQAEAARLEALNQTKKADTQNELGRLLLDRLTQHNQSCPSGVSADQVLISKAQMAAQNGNSEAYYMLGIIYQCGLGIPRDYDQAREWYEKAAAAGDASAMRNIGGLYDTGGGMPRDYNKAREWYEKAAAAGDAITMRYIGDFYDHGQGVPQDYVKAREWYEKAATAGDAIAMRYVGDLYDYGRGVPQDYAEAREWYERAAAAGDGAAMADIGYQYNEGRGVPRDYAKAREWYETAAAAGNAAAMFNLGLLYAHGLGVPQDYAKAREWYEKAAAKDDISAMFNLGFLYAHGQGVPQDYVKAREWYEKGADKGDTDAMNSLGGLYEDGHGVPQDYAKALEWLDKAAAKGDAEALGSVSWVALFARDFSRALAAAEQYHRQAPKKVWTETNRAHALMFLGRDQEARELYLSHWGEKVPESSNKPWQDVVAEDFDLLRKAGLDRPLMKTVEDDFAAKAKAK